VVERGEHADADRAGCRRRGSGGGERRVAGTNQGHQAGVHRREVVHAAGGEQITVQAERGRRRGVGGENVIPGHIVCGDPGKRGEVGDQVSFGRVSDAEDGREVTLPVEREAVVDLPVQVHGELWNAQERAGAHEVFGAVPGHQASGQFQFPVEPGVQQRTAVDLHAGLQPPVGADGGFGLEFEPGRVGMGAENAKRGRGGRPGRLHPGDDGAVTHHVVPAGLPRPGVGLPVAGEPGRVETAGGFGGRVIGRRRGHDELGEIVNVASGSIHCSIQSPLSGCALQVRRSGGADTLKTCTPRGPA